MDEYASPATTRFMKRRREARAGARARHDALVGQRFGTLVVLRRYAGSHWECRCDCGAETIVLGSNLKNGNTKSCGWKIREPGHQRLAIRRLAAKKNSPEHRQKLSYAKKKMFAAMTHEQRRVYVRKNK